MSAVFMFLLLINSCAMGFTINANVSSGEEDSQELFELDTNYTSNFTAEPEGLEEANETSSPVRRDIAILIPQLNEYAETDNMPWIDDIYDQNSIHNQNNADYFNMLDSNDNENSTSPVLSDFYKPLGFNFEFPQKVYFYGPQSLQNLDNLKWNNEFENNPKVNKRMRFAHDMKPNERNACKRYLQFLKFAFENLDDLDDDNVYYSDHSNESPGLVVKNHAPFSTQMFAPTVFVDNSPKVWPFSDNSPKVWPFFSNTQDLQNGDFLNEDIQFQFSGKAREPWSKAPTTSTFYPPSMFQKMIAEPQTTPSNVISFSPFWSNPYTTNTIEPPITTTEPPPFKTVFFWKEKPTTLDSPGQHTTEGSSTVPPFIKRWEKKYNRTSSFFDQESYSYNYENSLDTSHNDKLITTVLPITTSTVTLPTKDSSKSLKIIKEKYPTENIISSTTTIDIGLHRSDYIYSTSPTPYFKIPDSNYDGSKSDYKLPYTNYDESKSDDYDSKTPDCVDKLPCPETLNTTYPLDGYCNIYVSCEAGKAIRRVCPEGLHYNIIIKGCDLPHNSYCNYACPKANGYFGIPGDCEGYFKCKNFQPGYRMCPPKMHWDIEKNTCVFAEVSTCAMKCTKLNEIKPYEGSCSSFITCYNGVPLYHSCPPNKVFDPIKLECELKKHSYCRDDPRLLRKSRSLNRYCKEFKK